MNRRDAVKTTTALLGGVAAGTSSLFVACAPAPRQAGPGVLGPDDQALIEEIADTILPPTASSPASFAPRSTSC
jgi:hypothetical protein